MMQPSLESFCPSGRNHYHHSKLMAVFNTVLVWGRTVGITYQAPDSVSVWQTQTRQDTLYSVKHRLQGSVVYNLFREGYDIRPLGHS